MYKVVIVMIRSLNNNFLELIIKLVSYNKGAVFMPLSIFGFSALWSPYLIGVIVVLTVIYFLVTVLWRKDFKVSEPLKKSEAIYFLSGMLLLYIIKGSPIDLSSFILFTMHMVQMAFLLLLLPILIIKGIPWWIWKVVVEAPGARKIFKVLGHPLIAAFGFALTFSVYHLPAVMDFVKLDETLHGLSTFILFLSAFFMYWPLINPVVDKIEGQFKMKGIYRIGYIIANAVLITPACGLIIFSPDPLYKTYTDGEAWLQALSLCVPTSTLSGLSSSLSGPELFTNMSAIRDQQLGGVLMKIVQEIILGTLLVFVFRKWWAEERKNEDSITENALKEFELKKQREQQLFK